MMACAALHIYCLLIAIWCETGCSAALGLIDVSCQITLFLSLFLMLSRSGVCFSPADNGAEFRSNTLRAHELHMCRTAA